MSGSDTLGSSNQGVSGAYGSAGAFGSGYFPGGRWGAPSWIDNNGNLWLFGGFGFASNGYFGYLNDLWEFNLSTSSTYTNEWAYMGGGNSLKNNYCAESPSYGTLGVFNGTNVPGGRQSAASWTDKSGNLWLFGGDGAGAGTAGACGTYSFGYLNDLWEFNPNLPNSATGMNGEWAWMGGSSTPNAAGVYTLGTLAPGAREYASTWTDKNGNFWLFGGFGYDTAGNFGYLNDLWEFNPNPGEATTNQWTWIGGSSTVPSYSGQSGNYGPLGSFGGANFPGGRYGASTWTDSNGNFWLFGGLGIDANGNGGNLSDLWEFNPTPGEATTNYWAWIAGSNTEGASAVFGTMGTPAATNTPGGSVEGSSWVDSSGNFWLFGGNGGELNNLWAFNPPTSQWVWMGGSGTANQPGSYSTPQTPAATNIPGSRIQTTSWTDTYGNFWLFGGDGRANNVNYVGALNDLWVYPPPATCWGPPSALQISPATLPAGAAGSPYLQMLTATGGCESGYTFTVTAGALPAGLTLSSTGTISGTPTETGTFSITVKVTDLNSDTGTEDYSLQIECPTITVNPTTLAAGTSGAAYPAVTFMETGGVGTTTFSESGALPTGMNWVAPVLSGTPTQTGSFPIQVTATDSNSCTGSVNPTLTINAASGPAPAEVTDNETITVSDTETFPDVADAEKITVTDTEVVRAYNAIAITPSPASFNASSGNGYATYAYTPVTFTATGGIGTLTLTENGALPSGITFVNGNLSGTPTAAGGPYTFSVTATDADGDSLTVPGYTLTIQAASAYPAVVTDNEIITVADTEAFPDLADSESIKVTDTETITTGPVIVSPTTLPNADLNGSYSVTFGASSGTQPYTWTATGLPAGLTMSTGGVLSGAPTVAGVFAVTVTVKDSGGYTSSVVFSLTVLAPLLQITANPGALTIVQGQTGETTLTFTPSGGYSGMAALSCSGLPANTTCAFTLNTANGPSASPLTFPGNNQPVNVVLTIKTDVNAQLARMESAPTPLRPGTLLTAIAFWCPGSLLGVIALRRKRKLFTKNPGSFGLCLFVLIVGAMAGFAGCISHGSSGTYVTPVGTSTVTVVVTPGSGGAQTLNIGVTIAQQ